MFRELPWEGTVAGAQGVRGRVRRAQRGTLGVNSTCGTGLSKDGREALV